MSFRTPFGKSLHALIDFLRPGLIEAAASTREGAPPTDTRSPARLGCWVLGVGFGGFLLWAAFAPLDEGVPTAGMVAIDTKRKAVQHISGGIVTAVHVREGQFVHAGDPLLEIDDAAARVNFESIRLKYYTLRAMENRLVAEQGGRQDISFHPDLVAARKADPLVDDMLRNQEGLFRSRRMSLAAELDAMKESIRGYTASRAGYQGLLEQRRAQLALLKEESSGLRGLVAEGYAPRNDLLTLERSTAETLGSIADLQGNIQRVESAVTEVRLRILQRQQDFRKEVDAQLADVRSQAQPDQERFEALGADLARTVLRAPADGQACQPCLRGVKRLPGSWELRDFMRRTGLP